MQFSKDLHAFCASCSRVVQERAISWANTIMTKNQTVKHRASVKAVRDKAPEGPKKAAALKHYQVAEKAHEVENDEEAHEELKQASRALM